MDLLYTPSFHFIVYFEFGGTKYFPSGTDVQFQEVSGLTVDLEMETYNEGGENRFVHKLPVQTTYSDVTLKRAVTKASSVVKWCKDALESFEFHPIPVNIILLNELHIPVTRWTLVNAIPQHWEMSSLNAEANELLIENLVLSYQFFTHESL